MSHPNDDVSLVIYLVPGFNAFTTLAFVDPFRVANYLRRDTRYSWRFVSEEGGRVGASVGIDVETIPISRIDDTPDFAIVSSGWIPPNIDLRKAAISFRRWDSQGSRIGGLSSGAYVLAEMGVLRGFKSTVHYETRPAFLETFPDHNSANDTYVIDGRRISSCGGTGSLDLALECISWVESPGLMQSIGKYIFLPNRRPQDSPQDPLDVERLKKSVAEPLAEAILRFEDLEVADTRILKVCETLGLTPSRLRNLSKAEMGLSPVKLRNRIRFDKARTLVLQTSLPITEIAVACGYSDLSAFSRAYKTTIGVAPSIDRKTWRRSSSGAPQRFNILAHNTGSAPSRS